MINYVHSFVNINFDKISILIYFPVDKIKDIVYNVLDDRKRPTANPTETREETQ